MGRVGVIVKRIVLGAFVAAAVVCGGNKHLQTTPNALTVGIIVPDASQTDAGRPDPSRWNAMVGYPPSEASPQSGCPSRGAIALNRPNAPQSETVADVDIERGWRLVEEATEEVSYAMPEDGVEVGNWGKRGTFGEWLRYELGWGFPLGSNNTSYSAFSVFNDAKIRPTPRDRSHEICAVGVPMLAVQGESRLWVCDGSGGETTLAWENFYLNADTNAPINAQIVLYESGDFVTRSNAMARYYTRIDPNDWDGDGLVNEIDDEPYTNDGDCFGTGEGWWAANASAVAATNANPAAYYWLEFAATADKTRVAVTCDGASDLGDMVVIARTNQACRVPLLIGATYAVRASAPLTGIVTSDDNAEVTFNDDIQVSAAMRRVGGNAPRRAVAWGRASADFDIDYPLDFFFVPPPLDSGRTDYALTSTPVNVGAEIASLSGVCCTNVTAGDYFNWDCRTGCGCGGAARAVYAAVLWEGYSRSFEWWGECPCGEVAETNEVHGATQPYLVMTMPRVLYTNGGGKAEDEDIALLHLEFHSPVPTNGTLTLTITTSNGIKLYQESNRAVAVKDDSIGRDAAGFTTTNLFVEGCMETFDVTDIDRLVWAWQDANGGVRLAVTNRVFVYHPIANIVNNTLYDNGDLCNPAAIAVGTNACFALEFPNFHPPAEDIKWSVAEGVAEFVGGRTGERVRVKSDRPNQRVVLKARIGDSVSRSIQFPAYVVDPVTVKATVWIVGNDEGTYYARSAEEVERMMTEVNSIFKQIGVSFYIDSISFTNRSEWLDIRAANGMWKASSHRQIVDIEQNTGGVELYFIDQIADTVRGLNNRYGALISAVADAETVAHELGHACHAVMDYWRNVQDIYPQNKLNDGTREELRENIVVREANMPADWNNGTGYRYYAYEKHIVDADEGQEGTAEPDGLLQRDLIARILMCGRKGEVTRRDLPAGKIYGYTSGGLETLVDVGFFTNGQRKLPSHD